MTIPRPMLATNTPWSLPLPPSSYPLIASPKIDGERALIVNGQVYSRSGKPIPSPYVQLLLGKQQYNGLDGELTVGPPDSPSVRRATRAISRLSGEEIPNLTFHIFDSWTRGQAIPFRDSWEALCLRYGIESYGLTAPFIKIVEQRYISCEEELLSYESAILAQGYEGLILRSLDQPYKHGRCTFNEFLSGRGMLKLKRKDDAEGRILAAFPLLINTNPLTRNAFGLAERSSAQAGLDLDPTRLGSLLIQPIPAPNHSFTLPFRIGAGIAGTWDDEERARLMTLHRKGTLIGRIVTFRFFPSGGKDRPVQPQFVAFKGQ